MLTIGVVEDHPHIQEALRDALTPEAGFKLLPPCRDQDEGIRMVQLYCPDLLLVDLCLPRGGDGVKVIRQASSRWGQRCISAVLTVARHEEYWLDAIHAGAKGFVQKGEASAHWAHPVRCLANGQSPLSADLARLLAAELRQREKSSARDAALTNCLAYVAAGYRLDELAGPLQLSAEQAGLLARRAYDLCFDAAPQLSTRETELLVLLSKGHSLKVCAEFMGVSDSTIKTYSQRMYEKLGVDNKTAALIKARDLGLLP